jgi:6-pyruvoyltetrahydropterin/6-carboxytetrahydropterin synthase
MNVHLTKIFLIEAAHRNPRGGPAQQRLHGHSYRIEIMAGGNIDTSIGWLVDYAELKRLFRPVHDLLDHGYLNELPGLEEDPSLTALARWIEEGMRPLPEWFAGVRVSIAGDLAFRPVTLPPDPSQNLPERLSFSFEAAQSLPQLPEGHPCRRIHGHSYRVETGGVYMDAIAAPLSEIYEMLDHRYLNDVEGLEQATCERISRWIWTFLEMRSVSPSMVMVQETPSARCLYRGQ